MVARNYGLVSNEDTLKALVDKLYSDGKPIGFDIETGYSGPDREKGSLYIDWDLQYPCGFSITNSTEWARYIPTAHDFGRVENAWEIVKPVLEELPVIPHNAKFEKRNLRALDRKGLGPSIELNVVGDSMLQSYALAELERHGLKYVIKEIFGHQMAEIESLFPEATQKALKALRFNVLDIHNPEVVAYACEDSLWCLAAWENQMERLQATPSRGFIYDLEMKTMELLCDAEDAGHATDWEALNEQYKLAAPFEAQMVISAREGLTDLSGVDQSQLNLKSPKQMKQLLYSDIGMSTTRKTKKGEPSTDAVALEGLSRDYPAIKKVLEVREVANLAGRLKKWSNDYSITHDKRVHPNFNQVVVGSGRFSADNPSIQQLPKEWRWTTLRMKGLDIWDDEDQNHWQTILDSDKTEFGKDYWGGNFRCFLCAAPNTYLLFFDYSQVELRALAGLAQEPYLIEAFNNGVDIHSATAAMMLGKPLEKVTKKDRGKGKTINFGIVYGMGAKLLAEQLAITVYEAQQLLDKYLGAFTKVAGWMEDRKAFGLEYGYVETYFGRRVTLWDLRSDNFAIRGKGERLCVNAPVQGTAADIMKISMLRAKKALEDRGWWMTKVRMINNVHDALTFEADNDIDPTELRELLRPCVSWEIPTFPEIAVDWEIGQDWGSATPWKDAEAVEFLEGVWRVVKKVKEKAPEPEVEKWDTPDPVVLELPQMPTKEVFGELLELLSENPGGRLVTIIAPEGTVDLEKYRTGMDDKSLSESVVRIFGGMGSASIQQDIDMSKLELEL